MRRVCCATLAVAAVGLSDRAFADKTGCTGLPKGASMEVVEYFGGPPTREGDRKCSPGNKCSLKGWLYTPKKLSANWRDNRAVVYLHGHDQERREPCTIAANFLASNWVVFAPLRSGNVALGPSAFKNSGEYIDDWAKKRPGDFEANRVEYLRSYQIHDVDHAIKYLKGRRFSGGKSVTFVSLMGHSYGGALAVFFSAGDVTSNPEAIADISGAELSWGDDGGVWKGPLKEAVRKRKVPIYFLQPRNGKSIAPTIVLSQEAATSGDNQFQATLFPPVITGVTSSDDVHGLFITSPEAMYKWGASVRDFFDRYTH
jgi:hypothetical protein